MSRYQTLRGEKLDLDQLSAREQRFLDQAHKRQAQKPAWSDFQNWYMADTSPIHFVDGDPARGERTGRQKADCILYKVLADLGYRLAIEQGKLSSGRGGARAGAGRKRQKPDQQRDQIWVSLPHGMAEQIRSRASRQGITISQYVRETIARDIQPSP